jgi:DNA phosphorothioation-dependent restriction protein DptH
MKIFQNVLQEEVNQQIADAVRLHVTDLLKQSSAGHCQRISTLTEPVMKKVCLALNNDKPNLGLDADIVYVMDAHQQVEHAWQVSATRLIELRNAQERPLLAFVRPGLKAAAGDSFDVSTFAEINLTQIPYNLCYSLRMQIPEALGSLVDRAIHTIDTDDTGALIRYYLSIHKNDFDQMHAGAAIFELGLVPDLELYNSQQYVEVRLNQNMEALAVLLDSSDSLLARIHNLGLKPDSIQADLYNFLRNYRAPDVHNWGKELVNNPGLRGLCFDKWPLNDEAAESILVYVHDFDTLPLREPGQPGPDNPRYLDLRRAGTVKVAWHTEPRPALVADLAYFRIELVNTESYLRAWQSKNILYTSSSKSIKVKDFGELDEGLYYFRVRAYTEGGELISREESSPDDPPGSPSPYRDPNNPQGKKVCESEDVWLWQGGDSPPPADPTRNVTVNSFLDAQLQVQFAALDRNDDPFSPTLAPRVDKTGWANQKSKAAESVYQIVYDAQTRFTLPISNLLRRIETETLEKPEMLGRWRLVFERGQLHHDVEPTERKFHNRGQVSADFMAARMELFKAIHSTENNLLVETADLLAFESQIMRYAEAYLAWLAQALENFDHAVIVSDEQGHKRTDAVLLDIDTVQVEIPGDTQINDRVYLIAPTHPLRLLWQLQRSSLAQNWLKNAKKSDSPTQALFSGARSFLRQGLIPSNLPPFLRPSHETNLSGVARFYLEQGPITPFWSLYVGENIRDRRAIYARAKRAMGIGRSGSLSASVETVDRNLLAGKIQRYLIQHPYIQSLKINAFNPGDAELLVNAILLVERERLRSFSLRYELHLFTQDGQLADTGSAVEELMNPQRQVSPEADAFSEGSQNHLFPKLRFYRHSQQEFLQRPEVFEAHLSILHDVFPIGIELDASIDGRSSFLHGLIQSPLTAFGGDDQTDYVWMRQLAPHGCAELDSKDHKSQLISSLLSKFSDLQAAVAAGKMFPNVGPTLHLKLDIDHKSLLNLVHETSDWVFIIDRNLGLEYFDGMITQGKPVYLLDFVPEFSEMDTERLFLTTQLTDEITSYIQPVLEERNLAPDEFGALFFLKLLRSMSGRLALKLLSAPNTVNEVLGLALARLFMEQFGLLEDSILIPLDAHLDLFRPESQANSLLEEVSFQRSDLLLIQCDIERRLLNFHIIEVKLRSDLGDMGAYLALRQHIESQLIDSDIKIRRHFDPYLNAEDRIDRQLKTRELIGLLGFYLERSERYQLITPEVADHLRRFVDDLDKGYQMTTTRSGLIFDFGFQDLLHDEEHAGLHFYRIGSDYINKMVETGLRRDGLLQEINIQPVVIEEAQVEKQKFQQIMIDTDMRHDRQYETIRSSFRTTTNKRPSAEQKAERKADISSIHPKDPANLSNEPHALKTPQILSAEKLDPKPETSSVVTSLSPEFEEQFGSEKQAEASHPTYDIMIGNSEKTRQYGIIGKSSGRLLALDLTDTNTISLFGVQGGGKSYTIGTIAEMVTQSVSGINLLPNPLATVIFHYHESQDYPPEFVSMVEPNSVESELKILKQEYGVDPTALEDVLILTSADKLSVRRREFPNVRVEPINFSSTELQIRDWRFLMGVGGNQMYMRQINMIMRELRQEITLETLKERVSESDLTDQQKQIADLRLNFASQFIDDSRSLAQMLRPGRLIIVDLRDEFIDKDEALGLFVVMLNIFANAGRDEKFNKMIVFDEAHKYMDNSNLTDHIVDAIRQMRHQGVSILIASQDPPSLPNAIIELSSVVIMHRFNSPQWLKHIQKSITAFSEITSAQMASLGQGEAFLWANKATERIFSQKSVRVRFRPRVTQHGGGTKTAA